MYPKKNTRKRDLKIQSEDEPRRKRISDPEGDPVSTHGIEPSPPPFKKHDDRGTRLSTKPDPLTLSRCGKKMPEEENLKHRSKDLKIQSEDEPRAKK